MPNYDLKKESKGNLWPNNDRSGKMPHYRGHVTVTKEQARHIMSHMKNGADEVKITIAAWDNTGDDGHQKAVMRHRLHHHRHRHLKMILRMTFRSNGDQIRF